MDIVNGGSHTIHVAGTALSPGGFVRVHDVKSAVVSTPEGKFPLKDVLQELGSSGRQWMAPRGGAAGFFRVARGAGDAASPAAVLYTNVRGPGPQAGLYSSPSQGLQYFSPSPGATVPGGFLPVFGNPNPTPAPGVPAVATLATAAAAAAPACPAIPMELYSLHRLFSAPLLAKAQGDLPPVQLRPLDGSPMTIDFWNAAATAQPEGQALMSSCTGFLAPTPASIAAAHGQKMVALTPRPQDVLVINAQEGVRSKDFMTHPRAALPVTFGQATFNLAPEMESAKCRAKDVERLNYLADRYADLRIAAANGL
jgi:hypothetical protein